MFDLRFSALSETTQLQLIQNVTIIRYKKINYYNFVIHKILYSCRCIPGQMIITEGDDSGDFYMVLGPRGAQVEVVKKVQGTYRRTLFTECDRKY